MIAVVDYGAGNTGSIKNAFRRLGVDVVLTKDKALLRAADKVIFPGVGAAASAMSQLREHDLCDLIQQLSCPTLGICLGMQLLCSHSEEGDTPGLGIFDTRVLRFRVPEIVPHMGWNNFDDVSDCPLLAGIMEQDDMYYVHSFYAAASSDSQGLTTYGNTFSAVLAKDNFFGVQFHPEKSGWAGQKVLQNFLKL